MLKIKKEKIPIILKFSSMGFGIINFSFVSFTDGDNFAYFPFPEVLALVWGYSELCDLYSPLYPQHSFVSHVVCTSSYHRLFNPYPPGKDTGKQSEEIKRIYL
jgi:hypothetical protein